jgi:hypothetical protein
MLARSDRTAGAPKPMDVVLAWILLIVGTALPMLHVLVSPSAGAWTPPEGARCPFGPRVGWLIVVILLPFVGWLLFIASRRRRHAAGVPPTAS